MFDLFFSKPRLQGGVIKPPEFAYLKRSLQNELKNVKYYYRNHYKKVAANNLFANLLNSLIIREELDDYQFSRVIEDQADSITRRFGIASNMFRGQVHEKGIVLGPETKEILVSVVNEESFIDDGDNWWDMKPINYLYHTRTDVGLPILNNTTKGRGFGILSINVPMLAVKYRRWRRWAITNDPSLPSVFEFVGKFVLPDLLDSYLDIAIFNRLDQRQAGLPLRKYPSAHPFYLTDYSDRIDRFNEILLDQYHSRKNDPEQLLYNIPLITSDTALAMVTVRQSGMNRNNDWVYLLRNIPFYRFIARHGIQHNRPNQYYLNQMYNQLRYLRNDQIFNGIGTKDTVNYFRDILNDTISLLKN